MILRQRINEIEKEIRETKYNKATEHHIGNLLKKLSKIKRELKKRKSSGKGSGEGYSIKKHGDATAIFVGFPSVGKSTLLNLLTNAQSKVGSYDFTTLKAIPGMMEYNNARIQLIDIPGIITGAAEGKGMGKKALSVVRNADLVIILVDSQKPEQLNIVLKELRRVGVRLDEKPPNIKIIKKPKGGLNISSVKKQEMSKEAIKSFFRKFGIINAEIILKEKLTKDRILDALMEGCHYAPSLIVFNKIDKISEEELKKLKKEYEDEVFISAKKNKGINELKQRIFDKVNLMRVFLKPQYGDMDDEPLIIEKNSTVKDLCLNLHKEFIEDFKYARVWGESAKFPGQKVGFSHKLKNNDTITIIT